MEAEIWNIRFYIETPRAVQLDLSLKNQTGGARLYILFTYREN